MSAHAKAMLICGAIAAFTIVPARIVAGQESLATARELYSSAAYDEALTVLGRLRGSDYSHDENRSIDVYRALCLMALGRSADAVRAIDSIVTEYPTYRPSANDLPPRVRAAFSDARRRLLPAIIQQKYTQAKAAWDRREFPAAKTGFGEILDALADPDMAAAANQPPLSDLSTLAAGFHDLSVKATAPPPPASRPAAAPAVAAPPPAPRAANR